MSKKIEAVTALKLSVQLATERYLNGAKSLGMMTISAMRTANLASTGRNATTR